MKLNHLGAVTEMRMSVKHQVVIDNPSHSLCAEVRRLKSTFSHVREVHWAQPTSCLKALYGLFHGISNQTPQHHHHHSSQHLLSMAIRDSITHFTVTKADRNPAHCTHLLNTAHKDSYCISYFDLYSNHLSYFFIQIVILLFPISLIIVSIFCDLLLSCYLFSYVLLCYLQISPKGDQ